MTKLNRALIVMVATLAGLAVARPASARKLKRWTKPNIPKMQKACDAGKLKTCVTLAYYMMNGYWGAPDDFAKAGAMMKKAWDGGLADGCAGLARHMSFNDNTLKPEVKELFTKSCDQGAAEGCYWLGRYEKDFNTRNQFFAKAYKLHMAACDKGDPEACHDAGTMNRDSHQDNYDKAVTWDEAITAKLDADACGAGFAESCSRLGGLYEEGRGVTQNDHKAKAFYAKGCKLGDSDGCTWKKELIEKRAAVGIRL